MKVHYLFGIIIAMLFSSCSKTLMIYDGTNSNEGQMSIGELKHYLRDIYSNVTFQQTSAMEKADVILLFSDKAKRYNIDSKIINNEGYTVTCQDEKAYIITGGKEGLLYATYSLLEHLGYGFYISGDIVPEKKEWSGFDEWELNDNPLVKERIVFTWHNFLSGCTG